MTFVVLYHLISDWSTYPTYTTIDSSAISIDTVPFPSVTVCQGDGSGHPAPSGGWGFVKNALDRYKLYNRRKKNFSIEKTEFGKDYEIYLNFTGNVYLDKLLAYLRRPEVILQEEIEKVKALKDRFDYDKYSALGKELLCDNFNFTDTSIKKLSDRIISEHASLFHDVVRTFQAIQIQNVGDNCHEEVEPVLLTSYYLLYNTRYVNEFGTLLALVAPLMGPSHSFKSGEKQTMQECQDLGQLELKLHELLVEMASGMGIPKVGTTNRTISLFELPALLESNGRPFSSQKSWMTQHPHYSCQKSDNFEFGFWYEELPCVQAWETYILSGQRLDEKLTNHAKNKSIDDDDASLEPPIFPCDIKEHECCPLKDAGKVNLTSVMNVMKFANRRGQSYFDADQVVRLLPMFAKYEVIPALWPSLELDDKYVQDLETYIPYCSIARFDNSQITSAFSPAFGYSTCVAFTPIVSNRGICYGFNSMHPRDLLNSSSQFHDSILSAYAPELKHYKDLEMAFDGQNGQGLTFYLDKQRVLSTDQFAGGSVADNGHFSISLNTVLNSFNVKSRVTQARMGHKLEILVAVNKLTVSDGVC